MYSFFYPRPTVLVLLVLGILVSRPIAEANERLHTVSSDDIRGWILEKQHSTFTNVTISFPFGSQADPENKDGLSFLLAELLNEDRSAKLPAIHTSLKIPTHDWIILGARVSLDRFILTLGFPSELHNGIPEIVESLLSKADFDQDIFDDVKEITIRRHRENNDAVKNYFDSKLFEHALKTPLWHKSHHGSADTIQEINLRDLRKFVRDNFRQDGTEILLSGPMDAQAGHDFLKDVYDAIPKGTSKWIEDSEDIISKIEIVLPGYVEHIVDGDNPVGVAFTFTTPGWKSVPFIDTWLTLKIMGCSDEGWLHAQIYNIIGDAFHSARLCWRYGQDEGVAMGFVHLKDEDLTSLVYNSLISMFLGLKNDKQLIYDWHGLSQTLLQAEWGTKALRSNFNDDYLAEYLPITPLVWEEGALAEKRALFQEQGLPKLTSQIFSPNQMQFLILR